jgi:hypothetical protein
VDAGTNNIRNPGETTLTCNVNYASFSLTFIVGHGWVFQDLSTAFVGLGPQGIQGTAGSVQGIQGIQGITGTQPITLEGFIPHKDAIYVLSQVGQNTIHLQPMQLPSPVIFDRVAFPVQFSGNLASTGTLALTIDIGFYKTTTGSAYTSAFMNRFVTTITHSTTVNTSLNFGPRVMTFAWNTTIPADNYFLAIRSSTTSNAGGINLSNFLRSQVNSAFSGRINVATNASFKVQQGLGVYLTTSSTLGASIAMSGIRGISSNDIRPPIIMFEKGDQ